MYELASSFSFPEEYMAWKVCLTALKFLQNRLFRSFQNDLWLPLLPVMIFRKVYDIKHEETPTSHYFGWHEDQRDLDYATFSLSSSAHFCSLLFTSLTFIHFEVNKSEREVSRWQNAHLELRPENLLTGVSDEIDSQQRECLPLPRRSELID